MIHKIHHLNCATLKPISGKIICHCLLLETSNGLILVDTGIGIKDIENPKKRMDLMFRRFVNPALNMDETAFHQIKKLGLKPEDVSNIIVTHLHEDHIGGLSDFPEATIIVSNDEYETVVLRKKNGMGYSSKQIEPNFKWKVIPFKNNHWNDFLIEEALEDISLLSMKGHTKGHCGVLLKFKDELILHCGDSYYSRKSLKYGFNKTPLMFKMLQLLIEGDKKARIETEKKVHALFHKNIPKLKMFCSHDPRELKLFQSL